MPSVAKLFASGNMVAVTFVAHSLMPPFRFVCLPVYLAPARGSAGPSVGEAASDALHGIVVRSRGFVEGLIS